MSARDQQPDRPCDQDLRTRLEAAQQKLKRDLGSLEVLCDLPDHRAGFLRTTRELAEGAGSLYLGQLRSRLEVAKKRSGGQESPDLAKARQAYCREASRVFERVHRALMETRQRLGVARAVRDSGIPETEVREILSLVVDSPVLGKAALARAVTSWILASRPSKPGDPPPPVPGEGFVEEMKRIRAELVARWRELKTWAVEDTDNDLAWSRVRRKLSRRKFRGANCPEWRPGT